MYTYAVTNVESSTAVVLGSVSAIQRYTYITVANQQYDR